MKNLLILATMLLSFGFYLPYIKSYPGGLSKYFGGVFPSKSNSDGAGYPLGSCGLLLIDDW